MTFFSGFVTDIILAYDRMKILLLRRMIVGRPQMIQMKNNLMPVTVEARKKR